MQALKSLLLQLPKTEIHLHLEALATVDTIWSLMKKHGLSYPDISTKKDLQRKFRIKNLEQFLDLFINIVQNCFQDAADIKYLIKDAKEYLKRNNIVYAEVFFAPSKFLLNGLDFAEMINTLHEGAVTLGNEDGIGLRYIVDVSRSFGVENAEKNLELTLSHPTESVIGIGLGGAEESGPAKDYQYIFEKAADHQLHIVAHAGEVVGPESIWDAINYLRAERIGHGISAIQDEELMDYLSETQIPLEICPTSNLLTHKYVRHIEEHPIRTFHDRGLCTTVNSDDPTLFGIDLLDEYLKLARKDFFSNEEIVSLIKNNLYATFLPKVQKDAIWHEAEAILADQENRE